MSVGISSRRSGSFNETLVEEELFNEGLYLDRKCEHDYGK